VRSNCPSNARASIRDDHAAIRKIKTAAELSQALGTIAAAVLQEEITSTEAHNRRAFEAFCHLTAFVVA